MRYKVTVVICATLSLMIFLSACIGAQDARARGDVQIGPEAAEPTPPEIVAPVQTPEPCPISEEEIVMLAQTVYQEANVLYWNGEKWGVSYQARQAAVAWVALNRLDVGGYGDTLGEVLSRPAQFAYYPDTPATEAMLELAQDVVDRWWTEKQGELDAGRTIPSDYLFFEGDGRENYFRKTYQNTGETWDWSLPDPYEEG